MIFTRRFYREEAEKGIFKPRLPPESVTEDWLNEHVFIHPPEVVGTAWDEWTAAPEVVALLARMEQEGKISSKIIEKRTLFITKKTLALELLVPENELSGYERKLVMKLFINGKSTTTEQIKEHYKQTGFDPATTIRSSLKRRVDRLVRDKHKGMNDTYKRTMFLFLAFIPLALITIMLHRNEFILLLGTTAPAIPLFLFSRIYVGLDDMKVVRPGRTLSIVFAPILLYLIVLVVVIFRAPEQASAWLMLSTSVFCAALFSSVFNGARVIASTARIELRRRLAAAREYFRHELGQQAPALRDQWLPYILAFGLGPDMDRWFKGFGAPSSRAVHTGAGTSGGSSTLSSGWSGGGGSFGGAGNSASWVSAVGTIANGVSSPGSGSSGGGFSGGGGSSGGGGGGGW